MQFKSRDLCKAPSWKPSTSSANAALTSDSDTANPKKPLGIYKAEAQTGQIIDPFPRGEPSLVLVSMSGLQFLLIAGNTLRSDHQCRLQLSRLK
jgi:hypothetical protein